MITFIPIVFATKCVCQRLVLAGFVLIILLLFGCGRGNTEQGAKNHLISVVNDSVETTRLNAVTTGNVFLNDLTSLGGTEGLEVSNLQQGELGYVSYLGQGRFHYVPKIGVAAGIDKFTYSIADVEGNIFDASVTVRLKPAWEQKIFSESRSIHSHFLLGNGKLLVLWKSLSSVPSRAEDLMWSVYAHGKGWSDPKLLGNTIRNGASNGIIAAMVDGSVVLSFNNSNSTQGAISNLKFDMNNDLWESESELILPAEYGGVVLERSFAFRNGERMIVFRAPSASGGQIGSGSAWSLWSSYYVPSIGWGMPDFIDKVKVATDGVSNVTRIETDALGNFILFWSVGLPQYGVYWSNRYQQGTGWMGARQVPVSMSMSNQVGLDFIKLYFDQKGNLLLIAEQNYMISSRFDVEKNEWDPIVEIGLPLGNSVENSRYAKFQNSQKGEVLVAWVESAAQYGVASDEQYIKVKIYSPESGWGDVQSLQAVKGNRSIYLLKVIDNMPGVVTVVWAENDFNVLPISYSYWANRYSFDRGSWASVHKRLFSSENSLKYKISDILTRKDSGDMVTVFEPEFLDDLAPCEDKVPLVGSITGNWVDWSENNKTRMVLCPLAMNILDMALNDKGNIVGLGVDYSLGKGVAIQFEYDLRQSSLIAKKIRDDKYFLVSADMIGGGSYQSGPFGDFALYCDGGEYFMAYGQNSSGDGVLSMRQTFPLECSMSSYAQNGKSKVVTNNGDVFYFSANTPGSIYNGSATGVLSFY